VTADRDQHRSRTMTTTAPSDAVLDFNPTVGMVVEGPPPDDPEMDPWQVTMVFAPGFAGPPVHIHARQEESYEVLSGVLDVFIDGQWRELGPGESVTVPAGAPHTIRNLHDAEMRALNEHAPALDFPRYMTGLHELVHTGKVRRLPPKDPKSVIYLSMLFTANERTLASVKPPQRLMRILAFIGKRLGYTLPTATM
jgi:mannose-6-phosphate isomerase-like protein (cupin superfamily)